MHNTFSQKKSCNQIDKIIDKLDLPKVNFIYQCKFHFHIMSENSYITNRKRVIATYACADISNLKYRGVKMFLLKLGWEL